MTYDKDNKLKKEEMKILFFSRSSWTFKLSIKFPTFQSNTIIQDSHEGNENKHNDK